MDSDKFGDPRTRSQRGRGRGRGRGKTPGRGRGKAQVQTSTSHGNSRGRGRGGGGSQRLEKQIEKLGSNADRFEAYDELRKTARRDGLTTDVDLYDIQDDEDEPFEQDEDDGVEREGIDTHVADVGDDDEADSVAESMMIAEFTSVAKVLAKAPLWARVMWGDDDMKLERLINEDAEEGKTMIVAENKDEEDAHVHEMMKELKELDVEDEEEEDASTVGNDIEKETENKSVEKSANVNEDDFDRWLDEV